MDFEIVMKNCVYDEVFELISNIKALNDGKEIAGWFTGSWVFGDNTARVLLDKFIIPKQDVEPAEVNIDKPDSMTDYMKELGYEEANRTVAHMHVHPFGKGKTEWSGTDNTWIKEYMAAEKGREIMVFILCSEDWMKARVVMNCKAHSNRLNTDIIIKIDRDNLEVLKEEKPELKYFDKLKARIAEKVTHKSYVYYQKEEDKKPVVPNSSFRIWTNKDRIYVELEMDLYNKAFDDGFLSESSFIPDGQKKKGANRIRLDYDIKKEEQAVFIRELSYMLRMIDSNYCNFDYCDYPYDDDQQKLGKFYGGWNGESY